MSPHSGGGEWSGLKTPIEVNGRYFRLSNENVSSVYDDRLDKIDPEGTLVPGQRRYLLSVSLSRSCYCWLCRNTGTSEGGTSPRDASPNTNDVSAGKEPGSKKAQLMAKVSLFSQVSREFSKVWAESLLFRPYPPTWRRPRTRRKLSHLLEVQQF